MISPESLLDPQAAEIRERAGAIARRLAARARASTTLACERAVLRLCGVSGLAANGRPLAMDVVERLAASAPDALRGGIGLPLALAALEYDLDPQQTALEVAAGHVDLALEASLLNGDRARCAAAERALDGWFAAAFQRFDANRTARRELTDLLGDAPQPWIGTEIRAFDAREASAEAASLTASGADLLRVRVPRDAELRQGTREPSDEPVWPVGPKAPAPAGSQRGLATIRDALDDAATRRGRYARLATRWPGLAAAEQAVVAGFERVDVVFSDPFDAIFELGVDPDRAFSDHGFAHSLVAKAGSQLVLGPGPLVAPEGGRGVDLDPATRGGRALAMQSVSLAFALENEVPAARISLGAAPSSATIGSGSGARTLAEVGLRSLLHPAYPLVVDDLAFEMGDETLPATLLAWAAGGARFRAIMSPAAPSSLAAAGREIRGALNAAAWLVEGREISGPRGAVLEHALRTLDSAVQTLRLLEARGMDAFVGAGEESHVGAAGRLSRWEGAGAPWARLPVTR